MSCCCLLMRRASKSDLFDSRANLTYVYFYFYFFYYSAHWTNVGTREYRTMYVSMSRLLTLV